MEALNKKERNDAYASFLVFFLITAAILLLAVFFAYQVPFKENERLRAQLKRYDHENEFMNTFLGKMSEAKGLLDSVNLPNAQAPVIEGRISDQVKVMGSMVSSDSIRDKRLYETAIQTMIALQDAKKLLRNSSATESNLGAVQQQLNDLRMQLNMCEQQKTQMQTTLMMYQNQR
ncbi:MAG TPA: type VI secretion system TssO [Chitinophagaceae bacterium]|nr:type VI secretion system TssO [Chitinophagaceae bacterium]